MCLYLYLVTWDVCTVLCSVSLFCNSVLYGLLCCCSCCWCCVVCALCGLVSGFCFLSPFRRKLFVNIVRGSIDILKAANSVSSLNCSVRGRPRLEPSNSYCVDAQGPKRPQHLHNLISYKTNGKDRAARRSKAPTHRQHSALRCIPYIHRVRRDRPPRHGTQERQASPASK